MVAEMSNVSDAFAALLAEREHQENKHGNGSDPRHMEAAESILIAERELSEAKDALVEWGATRAMEEMLQVTAVGLASMESGGIVPRGSMGEQYAFGENTFPLIEIKCDSKGKYQFVTVNVALGDNGLESVENAANMVFGTGNLLFDWSHARRVCLHAYGYYMAGDRLYRYIEEHPELEWVDTLYGVNIHELR